MKVERLYLAWVAVCLLAGAAALVLSIVFFK